MVETLVRNWWTVLIRGIAAVLFGILAWVFPHAAFFALIILFGAYALIDGIFAIAAAIVAAEAHQRWWAFAIEGAIGIILGLITFFEPHVTALALYWTIAVWAILTGIVEIIAAFRLRQHIAGELWLVIGGIISIVFGILLWAFPAAGVLTVIWLIAIYAIVFGILLIMLSLRLRGFKTGTAS